LIKMGNKPRTIMYRRKREGKTDFNKRLSLLLSHKPRLVVRFTNKKVIGQLVTFLEKGDKVAVGIDSSSIKKAGWNSSLKNIPATYLTGFILGKKAVKAGHKEAILDAGLRAPLRKGRIYAFLKGVVDGGLKVPYSEENIFPDETRLSGQHLKSDSSIEFKRVKQKLSE